MIDLLAQFAVLLGLALWLPSLGKDCRWLGARFALAGNSLVIYLFVGNVLLRIPVSLLAWAALTMGCLAVGVALLRHNRRPSARELTHPVFVLTLVLVAVAAWRGGISYQPYLGDELASWLNLTKQIYLADDYKSGLMDYHLPSYTNGWPLLLAATSSVYETYSDAHAVPFQFLLHIGVLGFVYDIVRQWARESRIGDEPMASVIAWGFLLIFLTGEVTWRLLPTDLLIEQPMLYVYATCFLLAVAAHDRAVGARALFAYWGVILCAGYLFKLSVFAIAPTLALFSLFIVWRDVQAEASSHPLSLSTARRLLAAGVVLTAPSIAAIAIWTSAAPGGVMGSSVGEIGTSNLDLLFSAQGGAVALRMFDELGTYLASYKLPVTLFAALGFVFFGWTARWRTVALGFMVFVVSTGAGLYLYYLYREPFAARGLLESFPRFINLPLRIFHLIGFLALGHAAIRIAATRTSAPPHARIVHICLIGFVCIGLGWQVRQVVRAADDMTDRRYQTAKDIQILMGYKADLLQIKDQVEQLNLAAPKLGIVDPRGDVAMTTALYYSLRTERQPAPKSYRYFMPMRAGSFEKLDTFDVLWPVNLSAEEAAVIAKLTDDPTCASHVNDYFLLRTPNDHFACLGKSRK